MAALAVMKPHFVPSEPQSEFIAHGGEDGDRAEPKQTASQRGLRYGKLGYQSAGQRGRERTRELDCDHSLHRVHSAHSDQSSSGRASEDFCGAQIFSRHVTRSKPILHLLKHSELNAESQRRQSDIGHGRDR